MLSTAPLPGASTSGSRIDNSETQAMNSQDMKGAVDALSAPSPPPVPSPPATSDERRESYVAASGKVPRKNQAPVQPPQPAPVAPENTSPGDQNLAEPATVDKDPVIGNCFLLKT